MNPLLLILIFIVSSFVGYKVISNVPSLLHTPLMSGMNALSGVIILGAIITTHAASGFLSSFAGAIAIILATINVIGGFDVTHKMLKMIEGKKKQ